MTAYDDLIATKLSLVSGRGFEPLEFTASLFDWQKPIVSWAIRRGRVALFEDCGLGKTVQQLEWANQVAIHTWKPVLILCPLAVAAQTVKEGDVHGIKVIHIKEESDVSNDMLTRPTVLITNYDRVKKFANLIQYIGGVVLDESSIIKGLTGKTRQMLTDMFSGVPFRLCCTATPAPNDFTELGQHAEFLGVCKYTEMLAQYFINDTYDTGTWRLKKHAVDVFWRWVASWAACVGKPSDIGFDDAGYTLPEVNTRMVTVPVDHKADPESGELFSLVTPSATQIHAHNRKTAAARCQAAAKIVNESKESFIVWCESNDESKMMANLIPDAVEVKGSDESSKKEQLINSFSIGESRVIITKPSIAGFGLNWQHCCNEVYVGLSYSFESFYQASKRIHRFGQNRSINRYIIQTDAENGVIRTLNKKQGQHDQMRELMHFTREEIQNNKRFVTMKTDITFEEKGPWKLYNGDAVRVAAEIKTASVGLSVFSPPFADLFTYSNDIQDMGNCKDMNGFIDQFSFLVDEIHRVLMPGRHAAVHCCDLLATKWKDGAIELKDFSGELVRAFRAKGFLFHSRITIWKNPVTEMQRTKAHGLLYKTLKSDSANSRVGNPEYLLVFRKRGENPVPIVHSEVDMPLSLWQEVASPVWMTVDQARVLNGEVARELADEKHICPLQLDVIERALHLWSAPGDLVYSPFAGIGSEGYCAVKLGRRFVGSELKDSYWKTACSFIDQAYKTSDDLFRKFA